MSSSLSSSSLSSSRTPCYYNVSDLKIKNATFPKNPHPGVFNISNLNKEEAKGTWSTSERWNHEDTALEICHHFLNFLKLNSDTLRFIKNDTAQGNNNSPIPNKEIETIVLQDLTPYLNKKFKFTKTNFESMKKQEKEEWFEKCIKGNSPHEILLTQGREDEQIVKYLLQIIQILGEGNSRKPTDAPNARVRIRCFREFWNYLLCHSTQFIDSPLGKAEHYTFQLVRNFHWINMSTFRTQVNPKEGLVASHHAALQLFLDKDKMREIIDETKDKMDENKIKKLLTSINKEENSISKVTTQFYGNNTPFLKATGISTDTTAFKSSTLKEATKFENKFSYYKFLKLIGINYTLPDHYNSIIEHCIITGERSIPQKEKSKLEDEHSLPFMILLGILYPEALRLVLTRMSNEYNHKYISKDLIKQQRGEPLEGQNITMSSFTYRVIDQLKSNKTYNR